jgi:hypothetical protein
VRRFAVGVYSLMLREHPKLLPCQWCAQVALKLGGFRLSCEASATLGTSRAREHCSFNRSCRGKGEATACLSSLARVVRLPGHAGRDSGRLAPRSETDGYLNRELAGNARAYESTLRRYSAPFLTRCADFTR